MLDLRFN